MFGYDLGQEVEGVWVKLGLRNQNGLKVYQGMDRLDYAGSLETVELDCSQV